MHSILRDLSVNIENNIYDESLPSIVFIRALSIAYQLQYN